MIQDLYESESPEFSKTGIHSSHSSLLYKNVTSTEAVLLPNHSLYLLGSNTLPIKPIFHDKDKDAPHSKHSKVLNKTIPSSSKLYTMEEQMNLIPSSLFEYTECDYESNSRNSSFCFTEYTKERSSNSSRILGMIQSAAKRPIVKEISISKLKVNVSSLTISFFDKLTREAMDLALYLGPNEVDFNNQKSILENLSIALKSSLYHVGLFCFSPTVHSQLDMEIALCLELSPIYFYNTLHQISGVIRMSGFTDILVPNRCKTPCIRMRDSNNGYRCELRVESAINSNLYHLFHTYSLVDDRFMKLCLVIKYWFLKRILKNTIGILSNNCYIMLVIHLLQLRGVLPCLSSIDTPKQGSPDTCYYFKDIPNLDKHWKCQNKESLGELIVAFFKYYSCDFPYVHGVVSIRTGSVLQKEMKGWTKEKQHEINKSGIKDRFWLCIEHPFDTQYNVGKCIDKETLYEIRGEFIRASKLVCSGCNDEYLLNRICQDKVKY